MKLKVAQIKELHEAFSKLDGYELLVKIDNKDKIIWKPYDLSGKTRWNIAKNVRILGNKLEGFDKVRNDLIQQIAGGENIIKADDKEKMDAFIAQIKDVVETEEEVDGLLAVTLAELKLDSDKDVNPIPTHVILAAEALIK